MSWPGDAYNRVKVFEPKQVDSLLYTLINFFNHDIQGTDFIECFTTTFLHTHSWLNWVDEDDDEVGLKEKPETLDTSKRLHQNKTRST